MKKTIITVILVVVAIVAGNLAVKSAGLYYIKSAEYDVASTTSTFLIGGTGTTTKTVTSDGYQQISWLVALASSTTPPTLCWKNQYSNNGTDWYGEDGTYASTTAHYTADRKECWTYSSTTADTNIVSRGSDGVTLFLGRKIVVPNLDTTYTRTIFSVDPVVRARLDIRSSLKNEVILNKN